MIKPLRKILSRFQAHKPAPPLLDEAAAARLKAALHPPVAPVLPPQPRGRIVKQTHGAEYTPDTSRGGGRIIKTMPRQLQKIKAAQEKVESSVEALED